jgi:hypothetical protein
MTLIIITPTPTELPPGSKERVGVALVIGMKFEFTAKAGLMQEGLSITNVYDAI